MKWEFVKVENRVLVLGGFDCILIMVFYVFVNVRFQGEKRGRGQVSLVGKIYLESFFLSNEEILKFVSCYGKEKDLCFFVFMSKSYFIFLYIWIIIF